jgi:hypothetical protein
VIDVGLTVKLHAKVTAYGYFGHATGQGVVAGTFDGTSASFGYVELTYRR